MDPLSLISAALLLLTVAAGCAAVGVLAACVYVIRHRLSMSALRKTMEKTGKTP
jgi:hypothetical protein